MGEKVRQKHKGGKKISTSNNRSQEVLRGLWELIVFLQGLWGILAGISVFFPFSNSRIEVIPAGEWYEEGGFAYFSSELVTTVASLITVFIVLWTFSQRYNYEFKAQNEKRLIQKQAWHFFTGGLFFLIIYLIATYAIMDGFYYDVLGWGSGDTRRLLGDAFLLLFYSAFFAMMTRAFMLLGMIEFFGKEG